jgi:predicted enzyme related to lactoylglutathione lyase
VATAFTFTKIVVSDLDRVIPFYRDAIGLRLLSRFIADGGDYAQEEAVLGGHGGDDGAGRGPLLMLVRYLARPAPPVGAAWTGFAVDDLAATVAAVERAGGEVVIPIMDAPEYKVAVAVVTDPEGHLVELTTPLG